MQVYINNTENFTEIGIVENGILQQFYKIENDFLTGSIFVGKVKSVKKNVGIFVDIGLVKDGLLTYREGLKSGDCVTVQVVREPSETKGCALTEKITLAGRFSVLNDVGEYKFSHKLGEDTKINLFGIDRKDNVGFIFRSACEGTDITVIQEELRLLCEKYDKIRADAKNVNKIVCIYKENGLDVAKRFAKNDAEIIFDTTAIAPQIAKLGERKVEIDGVELVFDKTEAMTVVDVNIHKFDKSFCDAETANFNANLIAVKELARQLRLRNIGGIIMVDFISLIRKENLEKLQEALISELMKDNVKTKVELVESIGMFAIVRKQRYSAL